MRLVILDSALKGRGGHHYAYDVAVATEARRRGLDVVVLAHARFPAEEGAPFQAHPVFSRSCYDNVSRDPVTRAYEAFGVLNGVFLRELQALPDGLIGPDDLVWVPTTTENQLKGLLDWLEGQPAAARPRLAVTLLMPAGVIAEDDRLIVTDPLRALYYRLTLMRTAKLPVRLMATGRQLARDYSQLAKREVRPHPLLVDVDRPVVAAREKTVLLYAGEASTEKGVHLLPGAVRRLAAALPDWRLLVHANDSTFWQTVAPVHALEALRSEVPNLDLRTGYLDPEAYQHLIEEAAVVVMPYGQAAYRTLTSGVLWEAMAAGRPVVVPRGTYLEREALAWATSFAAIDTGGAERIAEGVAAALGAQGLDSAVAVDAAARFRVGNGLQAFMDDLLDGAP